MKKIIALGAVAMLALAAGCSKDKKPSSADSSGSKLTEVQPAPPVHQSAQETRPGPVQTVAYNDPAADRVTEVGSGPASGRTYIVKKGDTLWGIAQRTYGDGKQYKRIATANPSIKGDQVNIGQKIVLP